MRQYIAMFDNGHDRISVIYRSSHRNYSRANREDAYSAYYKQFGFRHTPKLISTSRYEYN